MEVSKNAYYHMFLGVGRISNREKRVLGMLGQGVSKKNNRKILIFEKFPSHLKKPVLNCTITNEFGQSRSKWTCKSQLSENMFVNTEQLVNSDKAFYN